MKYLHLIWAALLRRKARTTLTLLSVSMAFLLFGLLDTVGSTFANAGKTAAGHDRIVITPKRGMGSKPLPYSLLSEIAAVPGVAIVDYASHVVGTYQDVKNSIVVEAHPSSFYDIYHDELSIAPAELQAVLSTRDGVLAGESLAKKYGLKVGDRIPIQTQQPRKNGSTVWTFEVVGILRYSNPAMKVYEDLLYGNWEYVEQSRAADTGTVDYYFVKASSASAVDRISRDIDALTANSEHETKSQSEVAWASATFQQIGDIGLIVTSIIAAVFFTLVLLAGHTMTQAVYERIPELAVLKTIGFSGRKILGLILGESVALILLGAVVGLAIASVAVIGVRQAEVLPLRIEWVDWEIWLRGLTLAAIIAFGVGFLPARRGMRLRIVEALRGQ